MAHQLYSPIPYTVPLRSTSAIFSLSYEEEYAYVCYQQVTSYVNVSVSSNDFAKQYTISITRSQISSEWHTLRLLEDRYWLCPQNEQASKIATRRTLKSRTKLLDHRSTGIREVFSFWLQISVPEYGALTDCNCVSNI